MKDLLPPKSKKVHTNSKQQQSYVLRSLEKLRTIEKKQQKYVSKLEAIKDRMSIYEHLKVKPAMAHIGYEDRQSLNEALTARSKSHLALISRNNED